MLKRLLCVIPVMEDIECKECGGTEFTLLNDDIGQTIARCSGCGEDVCVGDK